MRKKTILSIGGLTLAVGLGVAAIGGAALPLAFSAVTTGSTTTVEKVLEVVATSPSNDEMLAIWQVSNQITVQFSAGDQAGTWDGLTEINPACTESIKIGKPNDSWNGLNTYYNGTVTVPAEAVSIDSKNPNVAIIDVTKITDWAWESDDREYWVEIPAGYFLGGETTSATGSEDDPDVTITKMVTPAVGFGWTVNDTPKYTTSPASGAQLNSGKNELYTVTMTFPEGITAQVNADAQAVAELYYVESGTKNLKGTYTAKAEGNVVTLSLSLIQGISTLPDAALTKQQYYEVVIPAGLVNCLEGEFFKGQSVGTTINNLKYVYTFDASQIKVLDEDGEEFTGCPLAEWPETLTLEFPATVEYVGNAAMLSYQNATMYSSPSLTVTSPSYATYKVTMPSPANNTILLQRNKASNTTSITNNPQNWFNGDDYCLGLGANNYSVGGVKITSAFRFGKFSITDGVQSMAMTVGNINNGGNGFPEGEALDASGTASTDGQDNASIYVFSTTDKETKVAPADFAAITPEVGFGYLAFNTSASAKPNPATVGTAKITLYKDGAPVWEQVNNGKENYGHLWKARPSRKLINDGPVEDASSQWYIYDGLKKNEAGAYEYVVSSSTAKTLTNLNKSNYYSTEYNVPTFMREPGKYKIVVDEGFFVMSQTGYPSLASNAMEAAFTIVGEEGTIEYTMTPANGAVVSSLKDIVVEYPEGTVITVNEPTNADVKFYASTMAVFQNDFTSYPLTVTVDGNKVILSLEKALTTLSQAPYKLNIPGATWTAVLNGVTANNPKIEADFDNSKVGQGTMSPAPTTGDETIEAGLLQNPVYTSLMPVYDHGATTTVGNITLNKVSYQEVDGVKTLVKGAQVTTYTWTGSGNSAESETECAFTPASTFDANELAGLYAIYIPKDYFKYKGSLSQAGDFVFVYNVRGNVSTDFTRAQPSSYSSAWLTNGYTNLQTIAWETNKEFKLNTACTEKVTLTCNGGVVAEVGVNDVQVEEAVVWGDTTFPGIVTFHFPGDAAKYNVTGTYKVNVPAGFFTLDGEPVEAFYKAYSYSYDKRTPNFTYTLTPAAGEEEVSSLSEIEIDFTTCYDLNYSGKVATLTSEDGSIVLEANYPKIVETSASKHGLKFTFGNANTAWKSGKYTFEILPNSVMLEDPAWDEEAGTGNFEGVKVEYNLNYVPPFNLLDHMTLANPTSYTANQSNTNFMGMATGLGMIMLDVDTKSSEFTPGENPEFVTISYSATKDGEYTVLKTLNPNAEGQVFFMDGTAMGATTAAPATLVLNFIEDGDGSFDFSLVPNYQKVGYYHVVIPNGLFTVGGKDMIGCELDFTYGIKPIDLTYTLAPVDNSVIEDLQTLMTEGIKVTFPGASAIDANDDATLTLPDGTVLYADVDFDGKWSMTNYVKFKFPLLKKTVEAMGDGAWEEGKLVGNYTFKVAAKAIAVDLGMFDEDTLKEGNSPEIVATYIVDNNSIFTGILLVGVEGADAYTVYTLDGKLVKANAKASDLRELENGLYIINGKKALLRK